MDKKPELRFLAVVEKDTVRTTRFEEIVPPGSKPVANYFYVQKTALAEIDNPGMVEVIIRPAKKEET